MNPFENIPLRDIHGAPAVPWWPPAPGWWVVAVLVSLLLAYLTYLGIRRLRRRRKASAILSELDSVGVRYAQQQDPVGLARELSMFVRRLALLYDRQQVSGLYGPPWLRYLDESGATSGFTRGVGRVLADAPYQSAVSFDAPALLSLVRAWTTTMLARSSRPAA